MDNLAKFALLRQQCFVNGCWIEADNKASLDVFNPATGECIGCVPNVGEAETRRAICAAKQALPGWSALLAKERSAVLQRWYELIMAAADDLAALVTAEQGKPLREAYNEVISGAAFVEWFAEEAKRASGEIIPSNLPGRRLLVIRQPIGVCAAITPWNFPASMITRKVAPALAAGCSVIIKPAEQTPLTALALAALAEQAGFPAGSVNVITGEPQAIGAELCANPTVRQLSFTGSTEVGRLLMAQSAPGLKKLSLELGGNAPFIVFDDANIDAAVEAAVMCRYRNNGQTCVCANRFLVQAPVYDAFVSKFTAAVSRLTVGPGDQADVNIGPLIDTAALAQIEAQIEDALAAGARILTGGRRHSLGGLFFQPTVLDELTPTMRVVREECFGPVAPVLRFEREEEAVQMANDSEYGLAAYFFSTNVGRVFRVAEALECGVLGINTGVLSSEVSPFGGTKQSGIGREGSHYGLDEFLEIKTLCLDGLDA